MKRISIASVIHAPMKPLATLFFVLSLPLAAQPKPEEIRAITERVADWQIRTFEESHMFRAVPVPTPKPSDAAGESAKTKPAPPRKLEKYHDLTWHMGALYAGMDHWRHISSKPETYTDWLTMIGERNKWTLHTRPYHADDHTVGQFYLSLYQETKNPKMLLPTKERFEWILANRKTGTLEWTAKPTDAHNRWGWCDALFMAPPVWARLAKITGDRKYLDFMDEEYHATYDLLFDKQDKLFWRDSSFFPRREANGQKLYWARGNGWVFGGLALMLPDLPEDWAPRAFYLDLYKTMAGRLREIQRPDGTWSMGLLGGVEGYPNKETSGTGFFTFGIAWGINQGLLDRATYEPSALKGWDALTKSVQADGLLGHVQPVGDAPGQSFPDKSEVYGVGAFLAAGSEIYKLVGGK